MTHLHILDNCNILGPLFTLEDDIIQWLDRQHEDTKPCFFIFTLNGFHIYTHKRLTHLSNHCLTLSLFVFSHVPPYLGTSHLKFFHILTCTTTFRNVTGPETLLTYLQCFQKKLKCLHKFL